ncbi:membrane protein [Microtetraspora sp. NBRC 13810]|uniref:CbtA family protein n=1 Tax=Microtetraspora sp. NBRC 13810 TaxID=3030990 RepID=UPI0024A0480E|nr:CbtA family protein [Microtetraspora sp. NBRC 13810]GLW12826.1 membrane protein [Microtetraspora sp. NBRC 13810]
MVRTLLVRGLLVGLAAGLLAAVFAFFVGEPQVDNAIAIEQAASQTAEAGHDDGAAPHSHAEDEAAPAHSHGEDELVSRPGQQAGLFLALALYGVSVGGIFGLAYAGLRGRVGPRSDRAFAAFLAGAAFVAAVLVPFLKYPANPPAVGDPETIGSRTTLYLVMVAIGLLSLGVAAACARQFPRYGPAAGTAGFLVPVIVAWALLPTVDEVPGGFPATLLWDFRVASLGTQLVLWTSIGVLYGLVTRRGAASAPMRDAVPS